MKLIWASSWPIILSIGVLLSIGILVIFSSSKELATQQAFFAIFGLTLFFLIASWDIKILQGASHWLYWLIIFLLIFVVILGYETRGSIRWIPLGLFNIQPSEFAKPVLILFLAKFWATQIPNWKNIFFSLAWYVLPAFLIFEQPDLGTFLTISMIWVGLIFVSRVSIKKIVLIIIILAVSTPMFWFNLHDYQKQRVFSFLSPQSDPLGSGYNIIQSTISVGSGGILGRGLGRGTQSRLQFLPEFRTDFIFASIAEEFGFVGSILIISAYLVIFLYSIRASMHCADRFGYLVIYGVITMLFFQTVVNIGMNMGVFPITGITLPLVSYGGSSVVSTLICLGFVVSVITHNLLSKTAQKFQILDEES